MITKHERIAAYREAARRVAEREDTWDVINDLIKSCPDEGPCAACQWHDVLGLQLNPHDDAAVVLAYCLAAEMVRTGDL